MFINYPKYILFYNEDYIFPNICFYGIFAFFSGYLEIFSMTVTQIPSSQCKLFMSIYKFKGNLSGLIRGLFQ